MALHDHCDVLISVDDDNFPSFRESIFEHHAVVGQIRLLYQRAAGITGSTPRRCLKSATAAATLALSTRAVTHTPDGLMMRVQWTENLLRDESL